MSEESDKSPDEQPAVEDAGPRCGERLAEARREQQITVLEVAKELHLDEPKVRALERNEFEILGAPVFAKGHLRKYASLVGVDEDDVFADYYAMTRAESMPPIVARRKRIRKEMSPGPWIAVIAVIVVVASAYWWFAVRAVPVVTAPPPQESQPEVLQPQQLQPEQLQPEELESEEPDPTEEDVAEVEEEIVDGEQEAVDVATPVEDELPLPADQLRVSVSFSGECWTEIRDAEGRQLFYGMGSDGQTLDLSGVAPITALFGNADNVEVQVNNSAYALPAPDSSNRTVRVSILDQ